MKKNFLTVITAALLTMNAFAQNPDFGFEYPWGGLGNNPQGWTSANVLAGSSPVVKSDNVIWHWDSLSANIVTKSIPGISGLTGGQVPDNSGLMLSGSITTIPAPGIKLGFAYSNRKDSLGFFVRYSPVNADSGFVSVAMTKFNYTGTNKRDTIGLGIAKIGGQINSFTLMYAVINYTVPISVIPDTCIIVVSSSDLATPQIGSSLWIDDLKWGTINTGLLESGINEPLKLSPNPSDEYVTVNLGSLRSSKQLEILDVNGKLVESILINSKIETFGVAHLANGMYFYAVKDKDAAVLSTGKFTVKH